MPLADTFPFVYKQAAARELGAKAGVEELVRAALRGA